MAQGKGQWKDVVLTAVISIALSLFTAYVAVGQRVSERPTREEVTEKIRSESPYIRDQALILDAMAEIKAIRKDLTDVKTTLGILEERTR